jgi:diguanylate cyclase (GGDEF)-like protein
MSPPCTPRTPAAAEAAASEPTAAGWAERLLGHVEEGVLVLDGSGRVRFANDSMATLVGSALGCGEPVDLAAFLHPHDAPAVMTEFLRVADEKDGHHVVRARVRHGDGWRLVEAALWNRLDDPSVGGIVVCLRDRSREDQYRRSAESQLELAQRNRALQDQLRTRQRFLGRLVRIQSAISRRAPLDDVLDAIVDGIQALLGDPVITLRIADPNDPDRLELCCSRGLSDAQATFARSQRARAGIGGRAYAQNRLIVGERDALADEVGAQLSSTVHAGLAVPIRNGRRAVGCLSVISTERTRIYTDDEQEMLLTFAEHASIAIMDAQTVASMRAALTDTLTGLPNRRLLIDRLSQSIERSHRRHESLAVLFVDLDGFKAINDQRGHAVGDELLVEIARRINHEVRGNDTAARLGGDEFIVALEDTDPFRAFAVARRLLDTIREGVVIGGSTHHVGATIGVSVVAGQPIDPEELVRQADIAMYRGKTEGRNGVVFFAPDMEAAVAARSELESQLHLAILREQIDVALMPVIRIADGAVCGVEALARWESPTQGLLMASDIVPIATRMGLAAELDRCVLAKACHAVLDVLVPWRDSLILHVNLSPQHLDQQHVVAGIAAALDRAGMPAQRVMLEITETETLRDPQSAAERLAEFRGLGLQLAIDDFGSGSSSLGHLEQFPIDLVKIDRSFIQSLSMLGRARELTVSMIHLAHSMGIRVVAEGVETAAQVDALARLDVEACQGYLYTEPLTPDAFARWMVDVSDLQRSA